MVHYFRLIGLALFLSVGFGSVGSADSSQQDIDLIQRKINSIISNAEKNCGDSFTAEAAVTLDLDLDGNTDLGILDESGFSCPKYGVSHYCGSAGCSVHLITADHHIYGHSQGWEIITTKWGTRVVLMHLHGSACDEVGSTSCHKVYSISKGKLVYQKLEN